jgi:hypothetical protein
MHWTLDQVRDLDAEEYDELIEWAQKRNEDTDKDSMDMDAVIEAKRRKATDEH